MKKKKEKKEYLLVKYEDYDAELNGFITIEKAEWEEYLKKLEQVTFPVDVNFGDRGDYGIDKLYDYLCMCDTEEISKKEYDVLEKRFHGGDGNFPWIIEADEITLEKKNV